MIVAVTLLFYTAVYVYVPTLPAYAGTLTANLAVVGVILSMYGLWQTVSRLSTGLAADWLGRRKPFIVAGLALAATGALVMASARSASALLAGRALTGVAAGVWVPLVVFFNSFFPRDEAIRATTILTLATAVAGIAATSVTGVLNSIGGYPLAFVVSAGSAGLALLIALLIPEERLPRKAPSLSALWRLAVRRDLLVPALLNGLGQYIYQGIVVGFIPVAAVRAGIDDHAISLITSLHLLVYTATLLANTRLVRRFRIQPLIFGEVAALAAGAACAALGPGLPWLMASSMLVGVGIGLGYPVLMGVALARVQESERSSAVGLHQSTYAVGTFVGPWFSGILAQHLGITTMFWITAVLALVLGLAGAAVVARPQRIGGDED